MEQFLEKSILETNTELRDELVGLYTGVFPAVEGLSSELPKLFNAMGLFDSSVRLLKLWQETTRLHELW